MLYVVFSKPVAGVAAYEPIIVNTETQPILEQAARVGLKPIRWSDGNTRFVPSHDRKRRGFAPVYE